MEIAVDPLPSAAWALTTIPVNYKSIYVTGYAADGDGGAGLYMRVAAAPTHAGKFRSVDRFMPDGSTNAANGGWWEIAERVLRPEHFGGFNNTVCTAALQNWIDAGIALRRELLLSGGVFKTDAILEVNKTGTSSTSIPGFTIRGTGMSRFDTPYPQYTAGSRIEYAGTDPIDAIIRFNAGFYRDTLIEDITLNGTVENNTSGIYSYPIDYAIKFADTYFSGVTIRGVSIAKVHTLVGITRVNAANGENVSMINCKGQYFLRAFYCNNNQSYGHSMIGGSYAIRSGGTFLDLNDSFTTGIGMSIFGVSGSFFPGDSTKVSTLIRSRSSTPITWTGGRFEQVTRLIDSYGVGGPIVINASQITIPIGQVEIEYYFIIVDGNENSSKITINDCAFDGAAGKSTLCIKFPLFSGRIFFNQCSFGGIRNVIPWGNYSRGMLEFRNCTLEGHPYGTTSSRQGRHDFAVQLPYNEGQVLTSRNALQPSGKFMNKLRESGFGITASSAANNSNYVAASPWVHSGTTVNFPQMARWPFIGVPSSSPNARFFKIAATSGIYQTLSDITVADEITVQYQSELFFNYTGGTTGSTSYVRFALVNDSDPTQIYDEQRITPPAGGTIGAFLIDLRRTFTNGSGNPRLVIENLTDAVISMTMLWQRVSDSHMQTIFTPTTNASVTSTRRWSSGMESLRIDHRFQPPLKNDEFGKTNTLDDLRSGDLYHSINSDRRQYYSAARWWSEPRLDTAAAQPTTGSYSIGDFVFSTAPSILLGKVLLGWSRLTTGSAHIPDVDWAACYVTNG